ncbi:DUF5916 domain-containing protein [Rhodothermus profundi]|uniref:DUF5916 domain-containing protein n=1 Tax=Rhodothermus profundi TaxID=633813 RepID=UPI001C49CEB1|nr:DUF5916 domain-containing protein [Rhodothermus profundi]
MRAIPLNHGLRLDGRLAEPVWQQAPAATAFRQTEPVEGAEPTFPTAVRVLYGPDAIYIGAMLYDPEPHRIRRLLSRRDQFNQADWFAVAIDSYFDRKTAYVFAVNAAGVLADGILISTGSPRRRGEPDLSWDAVWEAAVAVVDSGWSVEIRIPYAMLRFPRADSMTWGIFFRRDIARLSEVDEWPFIPRAVRSAGTVAYFGHLTGLRGLHPGRNLQITPYLVSNGSRLQLRNGQIQSTLEADGGVDLKLGLSSNFILDLTLNPDFGQVEVDPAVLNLTAFETVFEERRPFFTEGTQIFRFSYGREGRLFYSRRIGANEPIIAAAKISGRSEGGLSLGLLGATTGADFQPRQHYLVGRLRQELGPYSTIGLMATGLFLSPRASGDLAYSLAGGTDWDLRFGGNTYRFGGHLSLSHRQQKQQPALTGWAMALRLERLQGVWTYGAGFDGFDDRFDVNDVGQLRRNDLQRIWARLGHQFNNYRPFGPFQRADAFMFTWHQRSYRDHVYLGSGFFLRAAALTRGFARIELRARGDYLWGGYDLYESRGMGPIYRPRTLMIGGSYETDTRRRTRLQPSLEAELDEAGGRRLNTGLELSWNARAWLDLTARLSFEQEQNLLRWASNETFARLPEGWAIGTRSTAPTRLSAEDFYLLAGSDPLEQLAARVSPYPGFEDRYYVAVFGLRDTRRLEFTLRSTLTFSPMLSVQSFAQLLLARGRYTDPALRLDKDTLLPFPAYPKQHEFVLNSFRVNVVLRWEYRPGSVLYLVWTQNRNTYDRPDPFQPDSWYQRLTFPEQLRDTFRLFPNNAFTVKLTYLIFS